MSPQIHRYRITVTPIEKDGMQCSGRCTLEFDQRSPENWMRLLESAQQNRALSADQHAALLVVRQLLEGLLRDRSDDQGALAVIREQLGEALARLELPRK